MRALFIFILMISLCLFTQESFSAPQAAPQKKATSKQSAQKKATKTPARKATSPSKTQKKKVTPKEELLKSKQQKKSKKSITSAKKRSVTKKKGTATRTVPPVSPPPQAPQLSQLSPDKTIQASLFRNNTWLLPMQAPHEACQIMAGLLPHFITGALYLEPGNIPDAKTISTWSLLRNTLRSANPSVAFDITLDLRRFKTPSEVTLYMNDIGKIIVAEAWTFDGASSVYETIPTVYQAALQEARKQKRFAGGVLLGTTIPAGLDYAVISTGAKAEGMKQSAQLITKAAQMRSPGKTAFPIIALIGLDKNPGEAFAYGRPPSERRMMVTQAAKEQKGNVFFAYPVFGPLAMRDKAYDATRDEFMLDTIKRGLNLYNKNKRLTLSQPGLQ